MNKVLSFAFLMYPIIIYFLNKNIGVLWISLALCLVTVFRLFFLGKKIETQTQKILFVFFSIFGLVLFVNLYWQNDVILRLYPTWMSLAFTIVFALSLYIKRPFIQVIAEKYEKDFTDEKRKYTLRLTYIWTIWLSINTVISFIVLLQPNQYYWFIYNGVVFYLISGLLFMADITYRFCINKNKELVVNERT